MITAAETVHWPPLLRPLADASAALGRLAHGLEVSPLHRAWLWRETARSSAEISRISGHRVRLDRLMLHLAGVPLDRSGDDGGLAAARRVFLTMAPLFRAGRKADSIGTMPELFTPLWLDDGGTSAGRDDESDDRAPAKDGDQEGGEGERLSVLVQTLSHHAGKGNNPALIDLLLGLRRQAAGRRLPPGLLRLALPLSLIRAGVLPKAAPALLGGRLPLGATRPAGEQEPVTTWLARSLSALAREASGAALRLGALERRHRAWHTRLADAGLRRHARTPLILDLLAATPVLSASLVARHLGCSAPGAGRMLQHLAELGIVTAATDRSRWKIYLAGDLSVADANGGAPDRPLAFGEPVPPVDSEAIDATLDRLIADLDRAAGRAEARLAEEKHRAVSPSSAAR